MQFVPCPVPSTVPVTLDTAGITNAHWRRRRSEGGDKFRETETDRENIRKEEEGGRECYQRGDV